MVKKIIFPAVKISGFSFTKNADTLYYPVSESIRSILPICDEFVIAVGNCAAGDRTRDIIARIGDPKIRIIDTVWENSPSDGGHVFKEQTDVALDACSGDWCFYIQSDEVLHERGLDAVRRSCEAFAADRRVEGLLFPFRHFWGDYGHCHNSHRWYPREIRVVRNRIGVRSWGDAQSFRIDGRKLRVVPVDAELFHYGWVRPPALMQKKSFAMESAYHSAKTVATMFSGRPPLFDYGPLARVPVFTGTHPAVMRDRIAAMDWKEELDYEGKSAARFTHDRLKYRVLTFLEQKLLGGRQIGGFRNYKIIGTKRHRDKGA